MGKKKHAPSPPHHGEEQGTGKGEPQETVLSSSSTKPIDCATLLVPGATCPIASSEIKALTIQNTKRRGNSKGDFLVCAVDGTRAVSTASYNTEELYKLYRNKKTEKQQQQRKEQESAELEAEEGKRFVLEDTFFTRRDPDMGNKAFRASGHSSIVQMMCSFDYTGVFLLVGREGYDSNIVAGSTAICIFRVTSDNKDFELEACLKDHSCERQRSGGVNFSNHSGSEAALAAPLRLVTMSEGTRMCRIYERRCGQKLEDEKEGKKEEKEKEEKEKEVQWIEVCSISTVDKWPNCFCFVHTHDYFLFGDSGGKLNFFRLSKSLSEKGPGTSVEEIEEFNENIIEAMDEKDRESIKAGNISYSFWPYAVKTNSTESVLVCLRSTEVKVFDAKTITPLFTLSEDYQLPSSTPSSSSFSISSNKKIKYCDFDFVSDRVIVVKSEKTGLIYFDVGSQKEIGLVQGHLLNHDSMSSVIRASSCGRFVLVQSEKSRVIVMKSILFVRAKERIKAFLLRERSKEGTKINQCFGIYNVTVCVALFLA